MNMSPARDETPHRSEICALNHLMKALVVVPQPQETTSWSFHPPEFSGGTLRKRGLAVISVAWRAPCAAGQKKSRSLDVK
ncbi:uncharacterized [Tachysurus ichikawai]